MKEEVVRPKEVYKSCLFVGCTAIVILVVVILGYLVWLFAFYDPVKPQ